MSIIIIVGEAQGDCNPRPEAVPTKRDGCRGRLGNDKGAVCGRYFAVLGVTGEAQSSVGNGGNGAVGGGSAGAEGAARRRIRREALLKAR